MKTENRKDYFAVLKTAKNLLDSEEHVTSLEHQLHTRMYNSAFCALLLSEYHCRLEEIGNKIIISDGAQEYSCPAGITRQIIRTDYDEILAKCYAAAEAVPSSSFEEVFKITPDMDFSFDGYAFDSEVLDLSSGSSEDTSSVERESEPVLSSPTAIPSVAEAAHPEKDDPGEKETTTAIPFSIHSNPGPQFSFNHFYSDDDEDDEDPAGTMNTPLGTPSRDAQENADHPVISLYRTQEESRENEEDDYTSEDDSRSDAPSLFKPKWEINEEEPQEDRSAAFNPAPVKKESVKEKKARFSLFGFGKKHAEQDKEPAPIEEEIHEAEPDPQSFSPSLFQPKVNIREFAPEPVVLKEEEPKNNITYKPEEPKRDHSHDSGDLLMHRHIVTLKKRLGSDTIGPYRFTFWPTNVPDSPERSFAEMLVHVIDDTNKTENLLVFDRNHSKQTMKFDGKEMNVYGIWENGSFESHISLAGQTASMFDLVETIDKSGPEQPTNAFLSQFRLEKKGQPKHFIVPFSKSNRGEQNIPIVGYAEIKGVRHALKRMEGNTLKYIYDGRTKVITGHFEQGQFVFDVDTLSEIYSD